MPTDAPAVIAAEVAKSHSPYVPPLGVPTRTGAPPTAAPVTGLTPDPGVLPPIPRRDAEQNKPHRERRFTRGGRADPYARRRWPWVVGAIAIAMVVTGGGIFLRNLSSDGSASSLAPRQAQLAGSGAVPSSLRADCSGVRALPAGADAAISCTPPDGASRVSFFHYPTAESVNQAFDKRIAGTLVVRGSSDDCSTVLNVEHPYSATRAMSGNVACFHQKRRSVLVWTMAALSTLGVAERDDRQDQPLYDWWNVSYRVRLDQSPSPSSFTDQQSALLAHVPASIRASCQNADLLENATAALRCSSGSTDVFYTSYPDPDTMNAVYEAQRAPSGVVVDSRVAAPDVCPGEGPFRIDTPDLGRILCYTDAGIARATWTDDRFSILTEAIRTDDQFPQLMPLVGRFGPE